MPKKLTLEEFVVKSNIIHNNKYLYNNSIYINNITKLLIECKKHGTFLQTPDSHFRGRGCKDCGIEKNIKNTSLTLNEFVDKSNYVHNYKYIYDKSKYVSTHKKISILCKNHGEFFQEPASHLQGKGCPKCGNEIKGQSKKITTEEFIKLSNKIHNNIYDYKKTLYTLSDSKTTITCKIHGDFLMSPHNHISGYGCKKCALDRRVGMDYDKYIKQLPEFKKYRMAVRKITNKQPINVLANYEKRGISSNSKSYHLDHKFSVFEGFKNNISPEIIGNIHNIEFIPWKDNIIKSNKCSITLEKLMQLINSNNI